MATDTAATSPITSQNLIATWLRRLRANAAQHYEAAAHFSRMQAVFGIPATLLAAIVGSTVFATLQRQVSVKVQISVGALSVCAAILTSLQTFLKFEERAQKYRAVGAAYSSLRHHMEIWIAANPAMTDGEIARGLTDLETKLQQITDTAPTVPPFIWARIEKRLANGEYLGKS